jgi:hypothetical protein
LDGTYLGIDYFVAIGNLPRLSFNLCSEVHVCHFLPYHAQERQTTQFACKVVHWTKTWDDYTLEIFAFFFALELADWLVDIVTRCWPAKLKRTIWNGRHMFYIVMYCSRRSTKHMLLALGDGRYQ